jgi:hypothetical protein
VSRMDVSHRHFAKKRKTRRARENASGFKEPDRYELIPIISKKERKKCMEDAG